jgi:hypothetical protein
MVLIDSSVLFFNISTTDLRAATPYLSADSRAFRYLSIARTVLGRLLCWSFSSSMPWEGALEKSSEDLHSEEDCIVLTA